MVRNMKSFSVEIFIITSAVQFHYIVCHMNQFVEKSSYSFTILCYFRRKIQNTVLGYKKGSKFKSGKNQIDTRPQSYVKLHYMICHINRFLSILWEILNAPLPFYAILGEKNTKYSLRLQKGVKKLIWKIRSISDLKVMGSLITYFVFIIRQIFKKSHFYYFVVLTLFSDNFSWSEKIIFFFRLEDHTRLCYFLKIYFWRFRSCFERRVKVLNVLCPSSH